MTYDLDDVKSEISNGKKIRVAINGFGRIGRMIFRAGFEDPNIEFVAINDLGGAKSAAYFLKHDTAQGKFPYDVKVKGDDEMIIGERKVKVLTEKDIHALPWSQLDIDVVAECTGIFTNADQTKIHLDNGAKKVVISAPGKGECFYLVRGVNDDDYNGETIVSNGSCTTNSMTAIVNEINKKFGINKAMFATIHSVTGDQRIIDSNHKDFRRGRAAPFNIVPTTTGAAKSVIKLIPELEGKLHGIAYRVPTITGSVTDINIDLNTKTSKDEINAFLKEICLNQLQGVVEYSEEELVSTDIIGNPNSGIIDSLSTQVIDGNFLKLVVWYDNEWGFSNRMVEVIKIISKTS
ncbi:MAG: type I glyceraldehyde-3-phosphate dehydrogenase [Nanoarchaeota archaeon]|nr:type I glyceraldehyde-3-phosphate dehydrogenase [Nanoarchaeota archaeon]